VLVVFAISDEFNIAPQANMGPLIVGVIVAAVGASFGANTGYAINPARDFGPRLFAWIAGWCKLALPGNYKSTIGNAGDGSINVYFWIPIVAPIVGGIIAAVVYDLFIRDILIARGNPPAGPPPVEEGVVARDIE